MDYLKLTVDKLSLDAVSELVVDDSCGAVSVFVGTTRNYFEDKEVLHLEYEAYEPMAVKALQGICNDIRARWPSVHSIAIYHRLGEVPAREASVIIAISSPHRRDALDSVAHCIDTLKATVPIWKKEVYAGAAPKWKENKECKSRPITMQLEPVQIDKKLVQINVSNEELQKRIQSFIERKREQINMHNIQDFIPSLRQGGGADGDEVEGETCARVRTQFVKRTGSKGHLQMSKVHNEWGPQLARGIKRDHDSKPADNLPAAIAERVLSLESSLNVAPVGRDVYARLKVLEDRVAELRGISPEYNMFWTNQKPAAIKQEHNIEVLFTADDIARRIEQLETAS